MSLDSDPEQKGEKMKNLVIFASGNGSNAENVCRYFHSSRDVKVAAVFCNNPEAGVIPKMKALGIPVEVFDRKTFKDEVAFPALLEKYSPDLIALLGFLWLMPSHLVEKYQRKILNLHPALLPKHGGKGLYGYHVHRSVLEAGDEVTGITIHWIDDKYDEGELIFQARTKVDRKDTPEDLARKIWALEKEHVPRILEKILAEKSGLGNS